MFMIQTACVFTLIYFNLMSWEIVHLVRDGNKQPTPNPKIKGILQGGQAMI